MKRLPMALLALSCGLLISTVQPATVHANATSDANSSSTVTNSSSTTTDSSSSSDSSESQKPTPKPKPKPKPKPVVYRPISKVKKVNYYTKIGPNKSYNHSVYRTGGAKSSAKNMKPYTMATTFANKTVHITREETMANGIWLRFTYKKKVGWIHLNGTVKTYRYLNVPLIAQRPQLPTGCEFTATAMMLKYAGAKVTKMSIAKEVPRSSNPNKGFVGNPYSRSGWWIYPKGLMKVVKRHTGSAKNMTGASFHKMKKQIDKGHPVVIWVANVDGFVNHAITLRGYSKTRAYYNDPWTNKRTSMSQKSLHTHRKHDAYRALSY